MLKLYFNTLLFADDQVIIQDSEDKLQKFAYILNQMSKDYNLKISTDKTKIMAFKGKHLVRSNIEIDGSILEKVKNSITWDANSVWTENQILTKKKEQTPKNERHY